MAKGLLYSPFATTETILHHRGADPVRAARRAPRMNPYMNL